VTTRIFGSAVGYPSDSLATAWLLVTKGTINQFTAAANLHINQYSSSFHLISISSMLPWLGNMI